MSLRPIAAAVALGLICVPTGFAQTVPAQSSQNGPVQYTDEDFARDVQKAVSKGDVVWLADHARYPVRVFGKTKLLIRDKKAFLALATKVLGPKLKAAIAAQDPESLFRNAQGVMIGQIQNVWFYNFAEGGDKNDFRIITINND
jgi:hypothetical protein